MKTKHTTGQWELNATNGVIIPFQILCNGKEVAVTKWGIKSSYPDTIEEVEANAKLIAAAPELLASLDNLMASLSGLFYKDQEQTDLILEAKNRANSAIKQATT